jgi:hypothetical protein
MPATAPPAPKHHIVHRVEDALPSGAHSDDLPGLPSKAGYHSMNQWHRDAAAIIRTKPAADRSAKEQLVILKADMIGNRF